MATKRTKKTKRIDEGPAWFVVVIDDSRPSIYRCDSLPVDEMGRYVRGINDRARAQHPDPDVEFVVWMVGHCDWNAQFKQGQVDSFEVGTWDFWEDIPEPFRMSRDERNTIGQYDTVMDQDMIAYWDWDWAGKVVGRCVLLWEKVDRVDGLVEGVSFVSR